MQQRRPALEVPANGKRPNDGETPYHSIEHDGVPGLDLLWDYFDDDSRSIAVQHKVDYADPEGLRRLLELGADPDSRRIFPRSPLHGCVFRGHPRAMFEILFEFGAAPDAVDKKGRTAYAMAACCYDASPLGWAETGEHDDIVDYLQRDASRLDLRDAIEWGKADRVAELLDGTEPDAPIGGAEPGILLRSVAYGGRLELVGMLLVRGADPSLANSDGTTALDYAEQQGNTDVVDLIRAAMGEGGR